MLKKRVDDLSLKYLSFYIINGCMTNQALRKISNRTRRNM